MESLPDAPLSARAWGGTVTRWIVAASALALVLTLLPIDLEPTAGRDPGLARRIGSTRSGQLWAETAMRRADAQVVRLYKAKRAAKSALKATKKNLKQTKKRRAAWSKRASAAKKAYWLAYAARREAEAEGKKHTVSKKEIVQLRLEMRKSARTWRGYDRQIGRVKAAKKARKLRIRIVAAGIRAAKGRRESAEATLRGNIANMTALARQRVDNAIDVQLTTDGTTFSWPAEGRISQGYGCTGFRLNPPRGSCRHFHDGIDIANAPGTPIRAMAAGVVAYVGWNPSDVGGRAFIVVIVHPAGLVSRYGHMLPIRRVKAGQVVRRGEVIARMGSTGKSTGSHLHVELLRGSTPLDPNIYLPSSRSAPIPRLTKSKAAKERRKANRRSAAKRSGPGRGKARRPATRAARPDARVFSAILPGSGCGDPWPLVAGAPAFPPRSEHITSARFALQRRDVCAPVHEPVDTPFGSAVAAATTLIVEGPSVPTPVLIGATRTAPPAEVTVVQPSAAARSSSPTPQ